MPTGNKKHSTGGGFELSRRGIIKAVAGTGVALSAATGNVFASNGTEQVIVRAEKVEPDLLPFGADVIDELKATAAESQSPIVNWVEDTDGVELANQFWLANALLLDVDTDQVDIDDILEVEGVSAIHPNFQIEIPEPQQDNGDGDTDTTYGLEQIRATEAWETFDTQGEGARIAVLDTGIDPGHPDLDIDDENFEEFDADGDPVGSEPHDSHYHGTHVSGTVVGPETPAVEGTPGYGVAPEATLMHGLVLPGGGGTFAQILGGMEWSVENEADAINMSLGATGYFTEFIEPVRNAEEAGTLVISSSGNSGVGTSGSPANVYEAVAVGASDEDEEIAEFSSGETISTADSWGPAAPDEWPEEYVIPNISGPGVGVLSAIPDEESIPFTECGEGDIYCSISGTSMAAPHIAGLVGLMTSAAIEEFDLEQYKAALETTAWKPEGEPEVVDARYGAGIVDAMHATSRVGADSGVEGMVLDGEAEDETPIEGAGVELDGFPTTTDASGEYRIRALAGEYDVSANAFGFASHTEEGIEIEEDQFSTLDFHLDRTLDMELVTAEPDVVEAPDEFDIELRVANLDRLTVELGGTYEGDIGLQIDGEPVDFGEPIEFEDLVTDVITLTVIIGEDGQGGLELHHTLEWTDRGEVLELTTGPTHVVEEIVDVAVVDREEGAFGDDIVAAINEHIHPRFDPELLHAADALEAAENEEYGAYVVQHLGDDLDMVADFVEETADHEVGVVWLDQFGDDSVGIPQLAAATDDPGATFQTWSETFFSPPFDPSVYYHVERDHASVDEVAEEGDAIAVSTPQALAIGFWVFSEFHTYFEDFDGRVAGDTVAGVDPNSFAFDPEDALAVDELRSTVLASSLGMGSLVQRTEFEPSGEQILANATEVAASVPLVRDISTPPDRVDPGTAAGWTFEVDDLLEVELSLTDTLGIDEDDFKLLVNEEETAFDEPITFDEPIDDTLSITLDAFADTFGKFSLHARFRNLNQFGEEETLEVTFRPISVYDPPVLVPDDTEDLQLAVDIVAPGEEVFVDDGTYEVDEPDRGFQTGLYIGTPDITISALDDATPEVIHERDLPAPRIIHIEADGVTVDGLHANVVDEEVDEKNFIGSGIIVNDFTSNVTVRNCKVAGTFGIQFGAPISDVHVDNVTAIQTVIGVGTDSGTFGDVEDVTITNVTVTNRPDFTFRGGVIVDSGASRVTVNDCEIEMEDGEEGIWLEGPFGGGEDCLVANNEIVGDDIEDAPFFGFNAGILLDDVEAVVEHNVIKDTFTGIQVGDFGFGDQDVAVRDNEIEANGVGYGQTGDFATLEHNVIDAETGLDLEGGFFGLEAEQILARFNDLSGTEVPFVGEPDEPFFDPPEHLIFDCRQNYLGDRGYDDTIADGDIEYEPFLTAPPDEIDFSQPTEIGVDLYLDPGETYGLGIPGPSDQTIWDVLGVEEGGGHNKFAGEVSRWHHERTRRRNGVAKGTWQEVTGRGDLSDQDTLSGFKVVPEEGIRAVLHFQSDPDAEDTPPGRRDPNIGEMHVREGLNVVSAPAYGADDLFDAGSATVEWVSPIADGHPDLKAPGRQMSEWKAADEPKKPFSCYYVEVSEAGTIESTLDDYDPVKDEIYEAFGLDPTIHEDAGAQAAVATALDLSVEELLETVPDEVAKDALVTLAGDRIDAALSDDAGTKATVEALENVGKEMIEEAPDEGEELVAEALRDAIVTVIKNEFEARVILDPEDDDEELPDDVNKVMEELDLEATETAEPAAADD